MVQWRCFQCREDMQKVMLDVAYETFEGQVEGIQCPGCGIQYILEETVVETLLPVEEEHRYK